MRALDLDRPSRDFTREPALSEAEFVEAFRRGMRRGGDGSRSALPGRDGHRQHHRGGGAGACAVRRPGIGLDRARHRGRRRRGWRRKRGWWRPARAATGRGGRRARSAAPARRPGTGGDRRRGGRRAAAPHTGAARRLRLHGRGGAAGGDARRTRSTTAASRTSPPNPATGCCCAGSANGRCSTSTCGSAKRRAPSWRWGCCARRSPATSAWRRFADAGVSGRAEEIDRSRRLAVAPESITYHSA